MSHHWFSRWIRQYHSKTNFKENTNMAAPNFQLGDSQKVQYTLSETDAAGNPVAPLAGDVVTVVSSDTASLTVVPDATPVAGSVASGFLVAGKKLQVGVSVTATLTHVGGSTLTATDLIDIIAGAASSLSFGLGAPVAQ
jgi:formylmethanofuran dehydrogenase subunit E-like metal-binding protein